MKIFKRLQLRFILIPLLVGGTLLGIVFSTIFGITFIGTESAIDSNIRKTLEVAFNNPPSYTPSDRNSCVIFIKIENEYQSFNTQYYDAKSIDDIAKKAFSKQSYHFKTDSRQFKMGYKEMLINNELVELYAVFDYTDTYNSLRTLSISLVTIYVITLIVLATISYFFSHSAVKPIRDAFYKQQELVANASHELKTPLTVISANLDLVTHDKKGSIADNIKWLESAKYQLSRMNSLILQMLELSSIEAPTHTIVKETINVSELCEGILLSFEATCFEKKVELDINIQENVYFDADKTEVEKLITILVDNAVKYTPECGNIDFLLTLNNKNLNVKIKNSGEGMTEEQISNIFERFYKTDHSHKESGNSFGLGLSIAKSLTSTMNGDIICTSEVGQWTCFEIILPVQ